MAGEETLEQFASCWEGFEYPRTGNATLHDFHELLMIALCYVLCGGQGPTDMALFGEAKEPSLCSFLTLANGLPSHDTFSRLFRNLDPDQFRKSFQRFMAQFSEQLQGVVAHLTPRTKTCPRGPRRSTASCCAVRCDRASGKSPLHMISAWGPEQRLVLAQVAADAKSNEITAVPRLLRMLALKGTIVTAEALNCQRNIAEQIIEQKGDCALALKCNQGTLYDDVVLLLDDAELKTSTSTPLVEADHGRIQTRTATVSTEIDWLQKQHRWPGLKAIGKVVRVRQTADKTTTETAYYLLSRLLSPERFNQVARQHRSMENSLHWRLDVVINEDQERTRMGHGPENLAVLRHMVLNAMQREGSKGSLRGKFKRAGWDEDYLFRLLDLF